MTAALVTAALLIAAGFALRVAVPPVRWLYVPASVVGGLLGLGLMQLLTRADALAGYAPWARAISSTLFDWPEPLLALIFAALLLEKPSRTFRDSARGAARQGVMVWIIVLGQAFVGLLATMLLVRPLYDVPASFGQLIEAGFAGGHGTAGALGKVFEMSLDFPDGMDLGMTFATVGLIGGVVTGIGFVNLAVRLGWVRNEQVDLRPVSGLEMMHAPKPASMARVSADVIDPLAMQLVLVGIAFGIGWGYQSLFSEAAEWFVTRMQADPEQAAETLKFVGKLPLFLFTLMGGLTLRHVLAWMRLSDLVDPDSLKRITGVAIELLIVAAITSLRIEAVIEYLWPIVLLLTLGFAWSSFCLLVLARQLLPREHWLELGLINYGMSTGTTAQGMMLLRIVDKDMTSGAAEDYALAAPLSAPFIGGGVVTFMLPLLMVKYGMAPVVVPMGVVLVVLYVVGRRLNRTA